MDYNKIADLDSVALQDCESLYALSGLCTVINDGRIMNFEREHADYGQGREV